jgi:uncharacterized protein YjiS (DUF1127 family)
MSTITREMPAFRLGHAGRASAPPHQSDSWSSFRPASALFRRWAERRGQRETLAELAALPHLLNDVGLTRAQAMREARKPFWQR